MVISDDKSSTFDVKKGLDSQLNQQNRSLLAQERCL